MLRFLQKLAGWESLIALLLLAACGTEPGLSQWIERALKETPVPTREPETLPPVTAVTLTPISDGLSLPVAVTHAGDERLFIAEQHGAIRIVQDGELLPQPFLDVRDRLAIDGSERGLLGLAFHPDYQENGRFFIIYTNVDGDTELTQFTVDPDDPNRADPQSGQIVLFVPQPFGNHNGGPLTFAPDGALIVGMGDGGAVGDPYDNAQDPGTLPGSLLRLNVDALPYTIPPDNPFVDDRRQRGEVWMIGLRNPWGISFDAATGDLYVVDAGQSGAEEVNFVAAGSPAGVNFGWPIREGYDCYEAETCASAGLLPPIFAYDHSQGCAIVGGAVYRGQRFPALHGRYFFSDFCAGTIWSLAYRGDGEWERTAVYDAAAPISAFGQDVNGELLALTYRPGALWRIEAGSDE